MKLILAAALFVQFSLLAGQGHITHTPEPSYTSPNNAQCIDADGEYLHVAYTEGEMYEERIMYIRGYSAGIFNGNEVELSPYGVFPSIAAADGSVHVVFMLPAEYEGEIYYIRSRDNGETWEQATPLTDANGESVYPTLAVSGQTIHVVWQDQRQSFRQIYYKRSNDGGDTWTDDVQISDGSYEAISPSIAVWNSEVHIAWTGDLGIQYQKSIDAGQTWSAPLTLSEYSLVKHPTMTVSENIVMVCWSDTISGNAELVSRRSVDSGNTWSDEARPFGQDNGAFSPNIASEGQLFSIVWNEMVGGNWSVLSSVSPDGGRTWSTPSLHFYFVNFAIRPFVAVRDKIVHKICTDKTEADIAYVYEVTDFPFFSINTLEWGYRIGADGDEFPNDIIKDDAGNIYITGNFYYTVDFDPGPGNESVTSVRHIDMFLAKYDPEGNLMWVRSAGGLFHDRASRLALDEQGNVYVIGEFGSTVDFDPGPSTFNLTAGTMQDGFVWKLDPDGNFVWAKHFGGAGIVLFSEIIINSSGHLIIGGTFHGSVDFDPSAVVNTLTSNGQTDVFLLELVADGNLIRAQSFGSPDYDFINDLKLNADDTYVITGDFRDTVDLDPGPGTQIFFPRGNRDLYLMKMNPDGSLQMVISAGSTGYDTGHSIVIDKDGNYLLLGAYTNQIDIDPGLGIVTLTGGDQYLLKLDPDWNFIWAKSFSGSFGVRPRIELDSLQNIYILASSEALAPDPAKRNVYLHSAGETDVFLFKLTPDGKFIWVNQFSSDSYSYGYGFVLHEFDIYVAGYFISNFDLDPTEDIALIETTTTEAEMFLMRISQCGPIYATVEVSACEAYDVPDSDELWDVSGTYHRQLVSELGCDSLLTIQLTIVEPTTGSETVSICDQFVSPSGQIWNMSGIYQDTLTNSVGCDSIVTYDLTILTPSEILFEVEACNSFTAPDGHPTLTHTGTFQEQYINAAGCDSIITYDVTITEDETYEYSVSTCEPYTTPDGLHTWTQSGVYMYAIPTIAGCDSNITVNATITSLNLSVTDNGQSLVSNQASANYQWINCGTGLPVDGAIGQTFYPLINGSYAAVVEANGCLDTTGCFTITLVGIYDDDFTPIKVYPNPTRDPVHIDLGKVYQEVGIKVIDAYGRIVFVSIFSTVQKLSLDHRLLPGVYSIYINADQQVKVLKIVVQ